MHGTGRGIGRLIAVAAVVSLIAGSAALAENVKLAKNAKLRPNTIDKLPVSTRVFPSPVEVDLDSLLSAATPSFDGLTFLTNPSYSGFYWSISGAAGAVGPNHIVSLTSGAIIWQDKQGTIQAGGPLALYGNPPIATGSFFESLAPVSAGLGGRYLSNMYSHRVLYDQYSERFVVMATDWTATLVGDTTNVSQILLAVSKTSNPNDGWYFKKINTAITIDASQTLAPNPDITAGPDALFITSSFYNITSGSRVGSRLLVIPKTPLYSGGTPTVTFLDPGVAGGFGGEIYGYVPVQMYGPVPDGLLTFLLTFDYVSADDNSIDLYGILEVDGTAAAPVVVPVTDPNGWTGFYNVLGDYCDWSIAPVAAQQGTAQIINADGPQPVSVMRGNHLWTVITSVLPSGFNANQPTVHWVHLDLETGWTSGDIDGENLAVGTSTYYPSVNVNSAGSVAISFVASGPSLYPGAYYTARKATDPDGLFNTPKPLAAGQDYYYRVFGGNAANNSIGPMSATQVDPVFDGFWSYVPYASTRGTIFTDLPNEDGRWATRWGYFSLTETPGDFNADGYVDDADMTKFKACMTGPKVPYVPTALPAGCDLTPDPGNIIGADFDRDNDVDLADWGIMQRCFAGPGVIPNPDCAK